MPHTTTPPNVFDREFLGVRARLIELGAAMDRIQRDPGCSGRNPQCDKIRQALEILLGDTPNKSEQIQLVFSLPYEENWQK
jgi:hypothetical protein